MGRDHYAGIHSHRLFAANALHFAFFEHAQQLRLHSQRHIADLVQKDRPSIGLFKLSNMPAGRPGERTLLMPKQFRLNQLRRDRRAVQRDKWARRSRTLFVQRARHQFLARPRFSKDANPCLAGSYSL